MGGWLRQRLAEADDSPQNPEKGISGQPLGLRKPKYHRTLTRCLHYPGVVLSLKQELWADYSNSK